VASLRCFATTTHGGSTLAPARPEPLLTINDTCAWLAICRHTLYNLVRRGELEPLRVGERLRFEPNEIRDYLRRNRRDVATIPLPPGEQGVLDEPVETFDATEVEGEGR
jgi:excisionase family DNA binding protein